MISHNLAYLGKALIACLIPRSAMISSLPP